jgi:hypothetical protein
MDQLYDCRDELERMMADCDTLRTELEAAQRRLREACFIKEDDKVGFDYSVLDKIYDLKLELKAAREGFEVVVGNLQRLLHNARYANRKRDCRECKINAIIEANDLQAELAALREQARWRKPGVERPDKLTMVEARERKHEEELWTYYLGWIMHANHNPFLEIVLETNDRRTFNLFNYEVEWRPLPPAPAEGGEG